MVFLHGRGVILYGTDCLKYVLSWVNSVIKTIVQVPPEPDIDGDYYVSSNFTFH